MKTPREILLERHRATETKLDAIHHSAVAAVCDRRSAVGDVHERRSQTAATMIWHVLWRELFLPSRRIWAGLAAVWVLLVAVNVSMRDHSPAIAMKSGPGPAMILSFQQQEKLLTELMGPSETRVAQPATPLGPRPRSEGRIKISMV